MPGPLAGSRRTEPKRPVFPPQPQCEVHSPSRNKYGNIQEHRLQSHSKHFFSLHRVGTCRPDSDCGRPRRKKNQKKQTAVVSPGRRILRLNTETTSAVFQGAQSFGPLNGSHSAAAPPPTLDLWVPVQPCVCVCGWVSPLHHAHGQLLFSGSV